MQSYNPGSHVPDPPYSENGVSSQICQLSTPQRPVQRSHKFILKILRTQPYLTNISAPTESVSDCTTGHVCSKRSTCLFVSRGLSSFSLCSRCLLMLNVGLKVPGHEVLHAEWRCLQLKAPMSFTSQEWLVNAIGITGGPNCHQRPGSTAFSPLGLRSRRPLKGITDTAWHQQSTLLNLICSASGMELLQVRDKLGGHTQVSRLDVVQEQD